jgi:hypothetical protein
MVVKAAKIPYGVGETELIRTYDAGPETGFFYEKTSVQP